MKLTRFLMARALIALIVATSSTAFGPVRGASPSRRDSDRTRLVPAQTAPPGGSPAPGESARGRGRVLGEGGGDGGGEGGGSCVLFNLGEVYLGPEAGSGSIPVDIDMYCNWTAKTAGGSWLRITSGSQGSGPGAVTYVYDRFAGPCETRTLQIVVEGSNGASNTLVTQYGPVNPSCPLEKLYEILLLRLCGTDIASKAIPGGEESLELAHRFRDEVLAATPRGRDYTRQYYALTPEVVRIMIADPRLGFRAARLLERYTPALRSILDGPGATIGGADVDEIDGLLGEFSARAGLDMKQAIAQVRRDLRDPEVQAECRLTVEPGPSRLPHPAAAARRTTGGPLEDRPAILGPGRFGRASVPDIVAQAARGGYYLRMARQHVDELVSILSSHPALFMRLVGTMGPLRVMVHSIVEDGGATVGADDLAELDGLMQSVADEASPGLRHALGQVRRDLRDPGALAGFGLTAQTDLSARSKLGRPGERRVAEAYARLPLAFEASEAHPTSRGRFLSRGSGYRLALSPTDAVLSLRGAGPLAAPAAAVRMRVVDANPDASGSGLDRLPGTVNSLVGDRAAWHTKAPTFAKVRYRRVYPGIDLVYYGTQRQLEYDFVVAPGANPERITLAFDGAVAIDASGDLVVRTAGGELRQRPPFVYQEIGGVRRPVPGAYTLKGGHEVGFDLETYDRSRPLVIDPVLDYATYLGGGGADMGGDLAVDAQGNVYVAGFAGAAGFPTAAPIQPGFGGGTSDAFVAKMNPEGTALIYATFLGGGGQDFATGIELDAAGNAYVAGVTDSWNFPVAGALQPRIRGTNSGFVTKLDPSGSALVYSTYLGGSSYDVATAVAVDAEGNAFVTGSAFSTNLATVGSLSRVNRGFSDAFVAKVNPAGSALVYATYLGGTGFDEAADVAVDPAGNAYVTGITTSADFPTRLAAQPSMGGLFDAFVTKLNAQGSALVYSTFLGGSEPDGAGGIAVDSSGNAYVTGATASENFPVARPIQATHGGGMLDAFVAKLPADGASVAFSTFLGGDDDDRGYRLAIDATGKAFVTGYTASSNFPSRDAVQPQIGGASADAFVAEVGTDDAALVFSTYLGGTGDDTGLGIAVDGDGSVLVLGVTESEDFPTSLPLQPANGGLFDAFVTKIAARPAVPPPVVASVTALDRPGKPFRVKLTGSNFQMGVAVSVGGAPAPAVQRKSDGQLILKKGAPLEALFPRGQPVEIVLTNPDGGTARATFTRD